MRFLLSTLLAGLVVGPAAADGFKAGTASKVITPTEPLWMAGYSSRNKPCDTKRHDLWVKALALEDPAGNRCVLLTSDLCGIPRSLSEPVCAEVMKQTGLKREQGAIGFASLRGGTVAGEHDVIFLGPEERLVLSHRAESRMIFARGALAAARFLVGKPAGIYSMRDVIGAL